MRGESEVVVVVEGLGVVMLVLVEVAVDVWGRVEEFSTVLFMWVKARVRAPAMEVVGLREVERVVA